MNNSPNKQSLPITDEIESVKNYLLAAFSKPENHEIKILEMLPRIRRLETESLSKAHKEGATEERERIVATLMEMITKKNALYDCKGYDEYGVITLQEAIQRITTD